MQGAALVAVGGGAGVLAARWTEVATRNGAVDADTWLNRVALVALVVGGVVLIATR